jgi:hypothetical protein
VLNNAINARACRRDGAVLARGDVRPLLGRRGPHDQGVAALREQVHPHHHAACRRSWRGARRARRRARGSARGAGRWRRRTLGHDRLDLRPPLPGAVHSRHRGGGWLHQGVSACVSAQLRHAWGRVQLL